MKTLTLRKVLTISLLLSLLLILVILLSITMGSVKIPPLRSIRILFQSILGLTGAGNGTERTIILSLSLPLASFLGALLTILVVFYFGRQDGKIHPNTLLLAGVITGSFLSALIMFFISVSQREELHTTIFWLLVYS